MDDAQLQALTSFRQKFLGFDLDAMPQEAERMLAAGVTVKQFLDTCTPVMGEIGDKFEKGEYYLPQLVMAGEMFKRVSGRIKQVLPAGEGDDAIAAIVLGTPRGDIHDLGKDIFAVLAEASGFAVHNLGVDVPPEAFFARLEETGASILGLSSLLTTTFETIEEIVAGLDKRGLRRQTHIILGGGATEQSLVDKLGVDSQTRDAYEGLTMIKKLTDGEIKGGSV